MILQNKKQFFFSTFLFVTITFLTSCIEDKPLRTLPMYGPVDEQTKANHRIADFSLTNQEGKTITQKDFENKIYVADFFFTTCPSICPKMSTQMERVCKEFSEKEDVAFLSHTVNPDMDTPEVLKQYAEKHHARSDKWSFVTGDKKQIYDLARFSYLVDASVGDGGENDFVHTQNFALVDKQKRIRGYYDGTDSLEVNKLIDDLNILLKEK